MEKKITFWRNERLWTFAAIGIVLGTVGAAFILPGGGDLYEYYRPFEQGCLHCGYVPYFAQWFLWPLLLPGRFAWPMWTLISGAGFLLIARHTKVNPFLLMITLPMLSQLWGGQIDILIVAGFVLILKSRNPTLRGLGAALALVKPQLSFLPLLFLLFGEKRADLLKLLLIPSMMVLLSLFIYGPGWPLEWIRNAMALPPHPRRQASIDIWRMGIFLSWTPLLFRPGERRFIASLLVGSIATPFFSIYSYVLFLAFFLPIWAVPVSYSWVLLSPLMGVESNRYAWILPLTLFFGVVLKELKERRSIRNAERRADYA